MAEMDTLTPKARINKIKKETEEFLNDRKNANNLIDIIACIEGDEEVIVAAVRALNQIFSTLITSKQMYLEKPPTEDADFKGLTTEEKYRVWLRERYSDTKLRLLELLLHDNAQIQEQSLLALMKFLESEAHTPLTKISKKHLLFPVVFFEQIVLVLINNRQRLMELIARFQEFLEFDDVRYFTMKCIHNHIKSDEVECTEDQLLNVFCMLENLSMPAMPPPEGTPLAHLIGQKPDVDAYLKMTSYKEHKKLFTTVWLGFLRKKLTGSLYKKVLVILHEKVMPHMSNALLLADFLTSSYNIGGAISLLALNGIFVLVNSFNLEYPDFYSKLYALFEPSVFHVKYRARFFFLADLFLTSSHLPAYLVAAFAKKLSRLALTAPVNGLSVIIPFVYNLINRHPNCKALIHDPNGPQDLKNDPFDMDEPDPAKCKALESSLWEIKTLQNHYQHTVALEAKKIEHPLQPSEIDLSELLETTTDDLFKKEVRKKMKTMPVTFEVPKGLFGSKDDRMAELWCLE